jgi:glutamate decarboxylase
MGTFTLNFSRPGSQVVAQYYAFLRLGFDGYRRVQLTCREVAMRLASRIEAIGPYELLSRGDELPVFAFRLKDEVTNFTVFDVSRRMRERGWQVPAYTMPANREDLAVLRVVVRNGMSSDLAPFSWRTWSASRLSLNANPPRASPPRLASGTEDCSPAAPAG